MNAQSLRASFRRAVLPCLVSLASMPASAIEVLHTFDSSDGARPFGEVAFDGHGNLYGTTSEAGAGGCGTLFKLSKQGFETLHAFTCDATDIGAPTGSLLVSSDGSLIGAAPAGGPGGFGGIFRHIPGSGYSIVLNLRCPEDGCTPVGGLVRGDDGAYFGTASSGGSFSNGTIFRIDPATSAATKLHDFTGADGAYPQAALGRTGNTLFGTAWLGGRGNPFSINIDGTGFTAIDTTRGALFYSGMAKDANRHAWGAAENTRIGAPSFGGLYSVSASGKYTWEYSFQGGSGGGIPYGTPLIRSDGLIYGTTYVGGSPQCNCGTVFRYDPVTRVHTVLHAFTGGRDGAGPIAGLVEGPDGKLYGVTTEGGQAGFGVIFRLRP